MPATLIDILSRLDRVAEYAGPWRVLRDEVPLLRRRIHELRQREARLDDLLVVALVGGSGVGKSTLLNAIAGDELARTSEFRPCTSVPTIYHPPGAEFSSLMSGLASNGDQWKHVSGSALENLVLVDTPDSDTIVREHRDLVMRVLQTCDLILVCGSPEKYLDEATWSLLRPLQGQRAMVCVETKASIEEGIRDHWLSHLKGQGLDVIEYFRVNARRTLDRKLLGAAASDNEFDFPRLEQFLRHELDRERVQRIKRSNVAGLLRQTVQRLLDRTGAGVQRFDALAGRVRECDAELATAQFELARQRLFTEGHLWNFAMGREIMLRSKGIVGTIYRIVEGVRSLPARIGSWLPWLPRDTSGQRAAHMLTDIETSFAEVWTHDGAVEALYEARRSELLLAFAQAGFDPPHSDSEFAVFSRRVQERIIHVLRGPARDRLVTRARLLTCWPVSLLLDIPPIALVAFALYRVTRTYIETIVPGAFFLSAADTATIVALIIGAELLLLSVLARMFAWSARRASVKDLRTSLTLAAAAFAHERAALIEAKALASEISTLADELD